MPPSTRQHRFAAALDALTSEVAARQPHAMLPSEREIAKALGVSRTTVRRLLATLVADGIVVQRQGVGTFVGPAATPSADVVDRPASSPRGPRGFDAAVLRTGRRPASAGEPAGLALPSPDQAQMLGVSPAMPVWRLRRLRLLDDEVVALDETALPRWVLDAPMPATQSLHDALAARGMVLARSLRRVGIGVASQAESEPLGLAIGSSVAVLRRTDYLPDGRCCGFTRSLVPAARFDLMLEWVDGEGRGWDAIV